MFDTTYDIIHATWLWLWLWLWYHIHEINQKDDRNLLIWKEAQVKFINFIFSRKGVVTINFAAYFESSFLNGTQLFLWTCKHIIVYDLFIFCTKRKSRIYFPDRQLETKMSMFSIHLFILLYYMTYFLLKI